MNETSKTKINPNGEAIIRALSEHKGEVFAFAEIAHMAGIEAKTGYLTSAKKIASSNNMVLEMVADGAKAKVHTITEYPNGLKVEAEKEVTLNGYRLIDKE